MSEWKTLFLNAMRDRRDRDKFRGRTDWKARQFIKRQYESGKTNFYEVFDFYSIFTPIEFQVWQDIHSMDLPFLPQYPVGRYFADFADPKKRVAIECDGKQHDSVKDAIRDKYFEDNGWTVYRIPGRDCFGEAGTMIVSEIAENHYRQKKLSIPQWEVYEQEIGP